MAAPLSHRVAERVPDAAAATNSLVSDRTGSIAGRFKVLRMVLILCGEGTMFLRRP